MSATAVKIGLPSEMLTRLKRLAEMKGCSLEEVILQILDRTTPLLPEEKPPPNEASHGAHAQTLDSRAQATLGSEGSTAASYDRVASEYAAQFFGELAHKPLDRALLDAFTENVRALGTVADIGCGPGQVARYLADRGVCAMGIDLSPEMVDVAERLSPMVPFAVGSMLALELDDACLAGITAFYSIIHIPPTQVPQALAEFYRVLRPGGLLLLAFHVGDELRHLDEFMGAPVSLDFQFYEPETLAHALEAAGFTLEMRMVRAPYVPHEHPSQRGYLLARKPRTTET